MSKIVIVTGGSRGIGRAAALAAAAAGYDVAISYRRDRDAADDVVQSIRTLGRRGLAVAADSADEGAVVNLFAEVDRRLGPSPPSSTTPASSGAAAASRT